MQHVLIKSRLSLAACTREYCIRHASARNSFDSENSTRDICNTRDICDDVAFFRSGLILYFYIGAVDEFFLEILLRIENF